MTKGLFSSEWPFFVYKAIDNYHVKIFKNPKKILI